MSIIDSLITDRTQTDLSTLQSLLDKPLSEWLPEELAWFNESRSKGAYNYTDLNRVGEAMAYLAGRFNGYGYSISISPKIDWNEEDIPTKAQMSQYLDELQKLRDVFAVAKDTPEVPDTMDKLTYQEANDIEQILINIDNVIVRIIGSFKRSGQFTFWSGYRPLPAAHSDRGRTWEELDAMNTTWANWQEADWYLLLYGNLQAEGEVE